MTKFTKWLKAALVRAIKTVAQTAVATIGTAAVFSTIDWRMVASASLVAGLLSILTSVAGLPEVQDDTVVTIPVAADTVKANTVEVIPSTKEEVKTE